METGNSKKIIFIPGWLDRKENFREFENVLDIWNNSISPDAKLEGDVIVAHSLGCHWTLRNWENAKDKKIIFINPLAVKKNIGVWFWRWIKFSLGELTYRRRKHIINPIKILRDIVCCVRLLRRDMFSVLKNNDNSNIAVIRGKEDIYFCDSYSCKALESYNVKMIEVPGVGHLWNEKIDGEIGKIVASRWS